MEEIIDSKILEYDKSTFLIDLVKHNSGAVYVNIKQSIVGRASQSEIKINPSILTDLLFVLSNYDEKIGSKDYLRHKSYFSPEKQKSVIERYLKGVPIEDLTLQFNCSKTIIEQIIINNEIEIVDNKQPKKFRRSRGFRKKR